MSEKNQLGESTPKPDEKVFISSNLLANYIDITIRGLIAFLTLGMFSYLVLMRLFNLPIWIVLPIIFVASLFISPYLSKIQLGEKIQDKYDDFLRKVIKILKR